jgi:hypothetical protein
MRWPTEARSVATVIRFRFSRGFRTALIVATRDASLAHGLERR